MHNEDLILTSLLAIINTFYSIDNTKKCLRVFTEGISIL